MNIKIFDIKGQKFTSKSGIDVWKEKLDEGVLSTDHFYQHWRIWVPKIFSIDSFHSCLEWTFNEKKAQEILFGTLEKFICNGDPNEVLKNLGTNSSVCGKYFKDGDLFYSCNECGVDSRTVLCVDCFNQSAHKDHKYNMNTSNDGGCCDCGNTEAWKKEPFCKTHQAGAESKDTNKLPEDVAKRAKITFEAVLKYCYGLLFMKDNLNLPADFCVSKNIIANNSVSSMGSIDRYCSVLYKNEGYTSDQQVKNLTNLLKFSESDAVKYVNKMDKDGRIVVKCAGFQQCTELKKEFKKLHLKMWVEHTRVVSHQIFAEKLLSWLERFISRSKDFRLIFSQLALYNFEFNTSILKNILIQDRRLWKAARACWLELIMSGMLKEPDSKKELAIAFVRNYASIAKDFIRDNRNHSHSMSSLSVQLFMVPTLARFLVENHDALRIMLSKFKFESTKNCNAAGKLKFEKNSSHSSFERAQFILYDLSFLLNSIKSEVWTDNLRKVFLQSTQILLQILGSIQGMGAVVRQADKTQKCKDDWSMALKFHAHLSVMMKLYVQCCVTDKILLGKVIQLVLNELSKQSNNVFTVFRGVAKHSAFCVMYDVATEPVSFHQPLSRFLASLFLHMEKFGLSFDEDKFKTQPKPSLSEMIEPVLQVQAMVAQFRAGMCRKKNTSLNNYIYYYHNVKYRFEMMDKDILLLQIGAVLMESNEFVIHVLSKFNLVDWTQQGDKDNLDPAAEKADRKTSNLAEEFLALLTTIIGERYDPSIAEITFNDCLKRKIIHQLCLKPMTLSELNQTLSDGSVYESKAQLVINEIADYKNPKTTPAVYELKSEFYSEYNAFYNHYTKKEMIDTEKTQRQNRKKIDNLECCPPPKLPKLRKTFVPLVNLLQCDVMLSIMQTVLTRAIEFKAKSFSERQVHTILHMIGYALQEQESGNYEFFNFTEKATKWNIYNLLEQILYGFKTISYRDMLTWVFEKYRLVAATASQTNEADDGSKLTAGSSPAVVKPTLEIRGVGDNNKKETKDSQEWIMLEPAAQILVNDTSAFDFSNSIALGSRQTTRVCIEKSYTCVVCQKDQLVEVNSPAMVFAACVQQSTVLSQHQQSQPQGFSETTPLFLSSFPGNSLLTSTCGHAMHAICWKKFFTDVGAKKSLQPNLLSNTVSFDFNEGEYLCPECFCLSNTILPILPPLGILQPTLPNQPEVSFDRWLQIMNSVLECKEIGDCKHLTQQQSDDTDGDLSNPKKIRKFISCPIEAIKSQGSDGEIVLQLYNQAGPRLSQDLKEMIKLYTHTTYNISVGSNTSKDDSQVPLLAFKSTAYTIHAIEFTLKVAGKPLLGDLTSKQIGSLEALARVSAVANVTHQMNVTCASYVFDCLACFLRNLKSNHSILSWDPFSMLVTLISSLPNILSDRIDSPIVTGNVVEQNVLRLVFTALVVKILLTSEFGQDKKVVANSDVNLEVLDIQNDILFKLMKALDISSGSLTLSEIWTRVKECCSSFLRCCVLHFHYLTDVPAPHELTQLGGDTYENMCKYLGLPETYEKLFDSEKVIKLVVEWSIKIINRKNS